MADVPLMTEFAQPFTSKPSDTSEQQIVSAGNISIDPVRFRVWRSGSLIDVSVVELRLLLEMVKSPEKIFSREELAQVCWQNKPNDIRGVDMHICIVRRKTRMKGKPDINATVIGLGYK